MYCSNCGHELSGQVKFCPNCGAKQNVPQQENANVHAGPENAPAAKKASGKSFVIPVVAVLIVIGIVIALFSFGRGTEEAPVATETQTTETTQEATTAPVVTEPPIPDDGWHTENGKKYYYYDGEMYVDLQKIDGDYYYFYDDGSLAVGTDVDYDICTFKAGPDGKIERVLFDYISGEWSEDSYHFGNNGTSSILELMVPIADCTSMSFYLQAEGLRGATVKGKWKIYIRNNGEWEFVQDIMYTEPNGSFDIVFDEAKSFDAITAHPTVQGNASYSALFYPENVDCSLQVLLDLLK